MPRIPGRPPLDLSGKWAVVDLPARLDNYLNRTPDPHVLITHAEFGSFSATFRFGTQQGEIDGRVDEVWTAGAADVGFHAKDDTITGTMRYHHGDELPFVRNRIASPPKPAVKPPTGGRKRTPIPSEKRVPKRAKQ